MDLDQALIAVGQNHGAPLVADLLVAALDHAVALAGLAGLDAAVRRDLESLLGRRLRLHFGHFAILSVHNKRPPWHALYRPGGSNGPGYGGRSRKMQAPWE